MRRSTLALLRCPRCLSGPIKVEGDGAQVEFGPARCDACGTLYPLAEGILDLLPEPEDEHPRSLAERIRDSRPMARVYERTARSAFVSLTARLRLDLESEHVLVRSLLAPADGRVLLDLSCGTAVHGRRLAARPGAGPVLGLDGSLAMLDEALHHLREEGAPVDLIRGDPQRLPLRGETVDGVLSMGAFHLQADAATALSEVARVLRPGGRFVCGTLLPEAIGAVQKLEEKAGLHRRSEEELRRLCAAAGLERFQRVLLPPLVVFVVERP